MTNIWRAKITEEALAKMRTRIGKEFSGPEPYITVATEDSIRNFANAIGDYNPLYRDPGYAAKSRYGGLIAPPSMFYAFDKRASSVGGGLPGVHGMFAGSKWQWIRPVRLGERIHAKAVLKDLVERRSSFAGRAFQQIGEVSFYTQDHELVAVANPYSFRIERESAEKKGKHKETTVKHWSTEEIKEVSRMYREQDDRRRGAVPRYWEDVKVGDEIGPMIRGPLTVSDMIVWLMGWGGQYVRAHGDSYQWFDRHPAGGIPNELGIPEAPERVHWDNDYARSVGVPVAYDYGPQRISWMSALMTDWIGDDGFLQQLEVQVRAFVLLGDLLTFSGKVVDKDFLDGALRVHCEVQAVNQRGEKAILGTATAHLPSSQP